MTHQHLVRRVRRLEQMYARSGAEQHAMAAECARLKPHQMAVFESPHRFRILVAGRRFGKTYLALTELLKAASKPRSLSWYVAPTHGQARRIAWKPLKELTRPYWACRPNETEMRIELRTGGAIRVIGADNYDALRGDGLDFVVLDEYASVAKEVWPEILRPALADRKGRALFIGTPHGYNHFYDLYQEAHDRPSWATFQYTTSQGGNVDLEELEGATRELDPRTFRQEFEATFENLTGGVVYYGFDRNKNVEPQGFNPALPLCWAIDFNLDPGCSLIAQRDGKHVYILDELVLPNSNTAAACEAFFSRVWGWRSQLQFHPKVCVYGDATGNARRTSAVRTDWEIVRDFFKRNPYQLDLRVRSANPDVRDRVNSVNAMLVNHAGERRLWIDPKCTHLVQDLERVRWNRDAHGNLLPQIDKSDRARTHLTDALGYMIEFEFGMRGTFGFKSGPVPF
jgi:hypothetical protein